MQLQTSAAMASAFPPDSLQPAVPRPAIPGLEALSAEDAQRFAAFGWGPSAAPRFPTIAAAIAHQMQVQPEAVAAEDGIRRLSYAMLDLHSARLAAKLHAAGVRRGDAVCLYLSRSIEMIVGIAAVLRIGAAYVPQHVGVAPEAVLAHVARATQAKVILSTAAHAPQVPLDGQRLIEIDREMADPSPLRIPAMEPARPSDRAMVLFTSGTTGVPNGVQVTHANLANVLLTAPGDLGMRPGLRVGQILSIAFDMAGWETLGALANGATLAIRGRDIQETAASVDILVATPSILATLDPARCRRIRTVAVAGEPCPRPLADLWSLQAEFVNSCGPTETTIVNTAAPHDVRKPVLSIGRPTPNNTVYILDDALKPLPIGEKGEMWAGGACVTAGYLANPELTSERYRPDPFRPGHLMFRTRDLGRWTADGELEHFGRVDDLVKIRGFRVELDGVSAALEATPGCRRAATVKLDSRTLAGFVSPATVDPQAAAAEVSARLPYYCLPERIIALDELPRTPRGKIDKRALAGIARLAAAAEKEAAA
ncbi:amino acid adenylation domain-containing protein [Mangrovicoccus sp. HB161399]|uniref:amino acid adenylation domain-containing protein n=1 Tax=Mangrovicoccus sp. HB161399 TaxID=2720392 RepID=UPI0015557677|nr:amino acid adenylation domain-containing protein [Mangrovicoccus sp. HB161399]